MAKIRRQADDSGDDFPSGGAAAKRDKDTTSSLAKGLSALKIDSGSNPSTVRRRKLGPGSDNHLLKRWNQGEPKTPAPSIELRARKPTRPLTYAPEDYELPAEETAMADDGATDDSSEFLAASSSEDDDINDSFVPFRLPAKARLYDGEEDLQVDRDRDTKSGRDSPSTTAVTKGSKNRDRPMHSHAREPCGPSLVGLGTSGNGPGTTACPDKKISCGPTPPPFP